MASAAIINAELPCVFVPSPWLTMRGRNGSRVHETKPRLSVQDQQQRGHSRSHDPPRKHSAAAPPAPHRRARRERVTAQPGGQGTFRTRTTILRRTSAPIMSFLLSRLQFQHRRAFRRGATSAALVRAKPAWQTGFTAAADPFLIGPFIRMRPILLWIRIAHGAPAEKPKTKTM